MQVFEKIKDRILYHSDETKYRYEIGKAVIDECVKDIIKDLGLENNGWIPCSERLPSFEERRKSYCRDVYGSGFIVMIEGATMPTTLYIKMEEDIWFDDNYNYYSVVAWRPLPEPYQPKGE